MNDSISKDERYSDKVNDLKKHLLILDEDLGEETVAELTDVFLESANDILSKLVVALGEQNYMEIRDLLHGLRGNSSTFGFEALVTACKELEVDISENRTEHVSERISKIIPEAKENIELLKEFVKNNNAGQ